MKPSIKLPPKTVTTFTKPFTDHKVHDISTYQIVVTDSPDSVQIGMTMLRGDSPMHDRLYLAVCCLQQAADGLGIPLPDMMSRMREQLSEIDVSTETIEEPEDQPDPPPFEDGPDDYNPADDPMFE